VNALAPFPKRPYGAGTVALHGASGKWRIRTPGQHGTQHAGFPTRELAEMALEDAMRGIPARRRVRRRTRPLVLLRSILRFACEIAERYGVDVEAELRAVR
jgi:hypothetical protein